METYSFIETGIRETLDSELNAMSAKELNAVNEVVHEIRQKGEQERLEQMAGWFDSAILPILKGFASEHSSTLEIERDRELITATFRGSYFEISENSRCMRYIMMAATDIIVDNKDGETVLALAYDCGRQLAFS